MTFQIDSSSLHLTSPSASTIAHPVKYSTHSSRRDTWIPVLSHTVLCCAKSLQSCLTLFNPVECSPPGSSVHGILQARVLEWVAMPSSRDFPNQGIEPRSPALQADSLPSEPPGKPKNTGAGIFSLLQGILPTQELNWGLLHCRWILYQLSH